MFFFILRTLEFILYCLLTVEQVMDESRGIICVDNFFHEIRLKVKTIVCVDNLFLNPNFR